MTAEGVQRKLFARQATEARTGIIVVILISSLVFLILQARKDVLSSLSIQEARLAAQFAAVRAQPEIARLKTVLDDSGRAETPGTDRLTPLRGQSTLALPVAADAGRDPTLALLGVQALPADDTQGRFVIRNGMLFASLRNNDFIVMTSAPILSLAHGLAGRLALDIGCVIFFASLMLLIRESRLSDYSVRRLLDASPVPLVVLDADGRVEFANTPAIVLFSGDEADPVESLQQALFRQTALAGWLVEAPETAPEAETREFEAGTAAGPRHLLVSRQALKVRGRRMTIASAVDITIRHQAEKALVKAKNAAEELGRLKSESLAMISHELRTPVNGVLGLAEILTRQPLPETSMRIVRRLAQAGRTLGAIINDIFDLSLLEAHRLRLERRPFDPRETITGAVTLASAAAPEKGLRVRVSILTPLPPLLHGDPSRLQQIIINLVGNSIKFTEAGGIDVTAEIAGTADDVVTILIAVADTGIGIPPDVLPRLFQPFSQAETGRGRRFEGTGLGLAVTRALAEAMGGTIAVESEPGKGSTFTVRLPFPLAAEGGQPAASPLPQRILVVDDVSLNGEIVRDLLAGEGCTVLAVESALEAMTALERESFDIVLMDIRMPGMDGLSAARSIRAASGPSRHQGPIVGLTANPAPTDRPLYLLRGIDAVLEKPIDMERLKLALGASGKRAVRPLPAPPKRLVHLARQLGPERGRRIALAFREVATEAAEAIADRCSRLDLAGVAESAHLLSGAAANSGFERLSNLAAHLEQRAEQAGALAVSEAAVETIEAYRDAMMAVDSFLDDEAVEAVKA